MSFRSTIDDRIAVARQAVAAFDALSDHAPPDAVRRDAAILRFVLAFETVAAASRSALRDLEGCADPKTPVLCIHAWRAAGLIDPELEDALFAAAKGRDRAVDLQGDGQAGALYAELPAHVDALVTWLRAVERRVAEGRAG